MTVVCRFVVGSDRRSSVRGRELPSFIGSLSPAGEIPSAQPTLFEYFFDNKKLKWVPWVDVVPQYTHDPERKFSEILVPTVDTVRTTWLLQLMVDVRRPVVLVGETGTSKSATTANFLRTLDTDSSVGRY